MASNGRTHVAFYPETFEVDWLNGRIGAWVKHYRPDLVTNHTA